MTDLDQRRLWPGTRPPVTGSPRRRRGSVRRTVVVDGLRPEGPGGPLVLVGTGRDLATGIDDQAYLIDAAATSLTVDPTRDRCISAVVVEPAAPGVDALVGQRAGSGFRRALAAAAPGFVAGGSLAHQILDETPAATMISGSVLVRLGLVKLSAAEGHHLPVDICAGWADGGAMLDAVEETGVPLLGWGPPAPALDRSSPDGDESAVDPMAWHPLDALPPRTMRRRRLVDVWRGVGPDGRSASAPLRVEALFRDTYGEDDGTETVVHEYVLSARIDPATWEFTAASAHPGPLPAPECPAAATTAGRLVGMGLKQLRASVRDDFTGTTTCTHLNDVFRSLADVRRLWESAALSRGESA